MIQPLRRMCLYGRGVRYTRLRPLVTHSVFFNQLRQLGCEVIEHAHPDHAWLSQADLTFDDDLAIIITEKDAVKCQTLRVEAGWVLAVEAQLPSSFCQQLAQQLSKYRADAQQIA